MSADAARALRELARCPGCFGSLDWQEDVRCESCGTRFPIVDGIPVLVLPGTMDAHKEEQASHIDSDTDHEWEVERPYGAPAFHRWLLEEKFRRSVAGLAPHEAGDAALVVCAGSGMDAEMLSSRGWVVLASDISLGAAQRVRERARRHGRDVAAFVADAERLPFAPASVPLVYVHDGLHHLVDPLVGVAEMARVSARDVSISEPARAFATRVAVKLGLALEVEEAGNRVGRVESTEIASALASSGFSVTRARRYAMYYKHDPRLTSKLLSLPVVLPVARAAYLSADALIGRAGNKLTMQATR